MQSSTSTLSPAQQQAFDQLRAAWTRNHLFVLSGDNGQGTTTVLQALYQQQGGVLLTMGEILDAHRGRHPLSLEETFLGVIGEALAEHRHVFLDDFHLLSDVVDGGCNPYPTNGWLNAHLETLHRLLQTNSQKLVTVSQSGVPRVFYNWGRVVHIDDFTPQDYAFFGERFLGPTVAQRINYEQVHRFANHLDAHQWRRVCAGLRGQEDLDTQTLIERLRAEGLASNVDLEEVEQVSLRDLRGVDEVVQALETHVVLPLENDELAVRFGLKPKRGVLLLGPPGTGKTTVGRALAHRLQGKFFLIDGTVISGTDGFYHQVHYLFERAKRNAPSVIFIDDSDVIFQGKREMGLYRYLLTMLDGLESANAGRVCVMLTAMELGQLPPALLRSGRIELWLEMHLPDDRAREDILRHHLSGWPAEHGEVDLGHLAAITSGLTGADLKRLAEDGKNLFAFDLAFGRTPRPATEYFLTAVETLQTNKEHYVRAERHTRGPGRDGVPSTPPPKL